MPRRRLRCLLRHSSEQCFSICLVVACSVRGLHKPSDRGKLLSCKRDFYSIMQALLQPRNSSCACFRHALKCWLNPFCARQRVFRPEDLNTITTSASARSILRNRTVIELEPLLCDSLSLWIRPTTMLNLYECSTPPTLVRILSTSINSNTNQ